MYYHGSNVNIKGEYLLPYPNKIVNNSKVVFATDEKWIALISIPKFCNEECEYGHVNGVRFITFKSIVEFNKLKKSSGYLYKVSNMQFQQDTRLGMINHEFISYNKVKIISREEIKDIYQELLEYNINILILK
jgi:hypothetical protein